MIAAFSLQHFRFHLEPKAPLHLPAYNKGNVIRGGFGSTFRRLDYKIVLVFVSVLVGRQELGTGRFFVSDIRKWTGDEK
jgi:hypothetical protein